MAKQKEWVDVGNGQGYWHIVDLDAKHNFKLPFFCPHEDCKRPTGTLDDQYLLQYGLCRTCYVMLVEDRKQPLVDVDVYRKRLQERGY